MEDSLFKRDDTIPHAQNETLIQALLLQGVGRQIKEDISIGKKDVLNRLVPKTRGLQRLLRGINNNNDDHFLIKGADDATEILDVVYNIVNSKFTIQNVTYESDNM